MRSKLLASLLAIMVISLGATAVNGFTVSADNEKPVPAGNVIANYSVETDTAGYSGNGCSIEVSSDVAYDGASSLKVSGRAAGQSWPGFQMDVSNLEFDVQYEYSFYVYSENYLDMQASWSPWAMNAAGQWIWVYGAGNWTGVPAQTWTKISSIFTISVIKGELFIVVPGAVEGTVSYFQAVDGTGANTGNDFASFANFRISCAATVDAEFYVDMITIAPVVEEGGEEGGEEIAAPAGNVIANYGFESDSNGYAPNGCAIAVSSDVAYEGSNSLKVSERQAGEVWPGFSFDVTNLEFNKQYEYSFYVYSENYLDILAAWSPWATNAAGQWIWVYGAGNWTGVPAQTWTKVSCIFSIEVIDGGLYIVTPGAVEGTTSYLQAVDGTGANTGNDFASFSCFRISCNATAGAEFYVDMVTIAPVEASGEEGGEEGGEEVPGPTGYGDGVDASLLPGNMMSNATFDTDMFSTSIVNTGMWYYEPALSCERVKINEEYSQNGAEDGWGSCAQLYNREFARTTFETRSLNIWVSNVYTIGGYVSAKQATKGGLVIRMWAYYDAYTDANTDGRYPYAEYVLPFEDLVPGEWTYFTATFGWVFEVTNEDDQTGILTLQIYDGDHEGAQVVKEFACTVSNGLSAFEFGFMTDATADNYLTDLYFDNYTLFNVTAQIWPEEEGGEEGGGDIVIPGPGGEEGGEDGPAITPGEDDDVVPAKGCKSSIGTVGLPMALALAVGFFLKKKKE